VGWSRQPSPASARSCLFLWNVRVALAEKVAGEVEPPQPAELLERALRDLLGRRLRAARRVAAIAAAARGGGVRRGKLPLRREPDRERGEPLAVDVVRAQEDLARKDRGRADGGERADGGARA